MAEVYKAVGKQDKVVLSFRGRQEVVQHISDNDLKVWAQKIVSDIDDARETCTSTGNNSKREEACVEEELDLEIR